MSHRVELTVPDELFERLELARGDVSRARWIKRALESALGVGPSRGTEDGLSGGVLARPASASSRAPEKDVRAVRAIQGVTTAAQIARERQARLNKAKS